MFIQLHALSENQSIWVNPKTISMITFDQGITTLAVAGGLALQVVESEADIRSLINDLTGYEALVVLRSYEADD